MNITGQTVQPKTGLGGKKQPATKAERRHMNAVAQMRCIVTGRNGVVLHHCFCDRIEKFGGKKAPNFDVIPLWQGIHQGLLGHNEQTAIHRDKALWVELHGPDWEYIPAVYAEIYGNENITHDEITEYWCGSNL